MTQDSADYAAGKEKAHFEVRNWRPGTHSTDCGCEPCVTARTVLEVVSWWGERIAKGLDEVPCRVCGCTDDDCSACVERTGVPCYWVERDLCSACTIPAADRRGSLEKRTLMTQLNMDLDKPQGAENVVDDILARYPKLAAYPRYGWRNKRAWRRLRLARPFLLDKDKHTYLVDEGGWARDVTNGELQRLHASKLLDQDKKFER